MEDQIYTSENIEQMRAILHETATIKGLGHPDVLTASIVLDQAISQYLRNQHQIRPTAAGRDDHNSEK